MVVVEDDRGGLVTELELHNGLLTMGRTPENDVVLPSGSISRQHCKLEVQAGMVSIADLNSSNGVYVDEKRIQTPTVITEDNNVRLGDYRLRLERIVPKGGVSGIDTALVSPEQAHSRLMILSGRQIGREILLFEPVTSIGRIEENDVSLPDISVSRHHAQLRLQPDSSFVLIDLNSSNGTFYRNQAVQQPTAIRTGDKIKFGNIECVLISSDTGNKGSNSIEKWLIYGGLGLVAGLLGALFGQLLR